MEQLSLIEESVKESIIKQMKIAISKGIIPGAEVIFDKDNKCKYVIMNLFIGNQEKLHVKLINNNGIMNYLALSNRLTVVGFYR
ncbi:MAG: hypothetical protein HUJ77_14015 [Clostridium sp.]|uniref:hypothetical protein n=1 Tax=Clostridium sp. TaxID=1506 RepID=UPI0025C18BF3|nr:hypothetical protein [Clostridium sp.]MCF0149495.1 hypothetical protein [Clostridium sp.]